jgi:O-methyltransferase
MAITNGLGQIKEKAGRILRKKLHRGNGDNPYDRIIPYSQYAPWHQDTIFLSAYKMIEDRKATLVDLYRCYELNSMAKQVSAMNPNCCNILEVGVYRGGTGAILASACKHNKNAVVHLVDTFEGVVKVTNRDKTYHGGEHADTSLTFVQQLLKDMQLANVKLYKGIFPDDVSESFKDMTFHMVHIDVDVYQSGKEVLEYVWPRLVPGGVVVFDDYGFQSTNGITELCNELQKQLNAIFIYNLNAHGIFVKI